MKAFFNRILNAIGRWILFRKDEEKDMAIGRSSMGQQIARPPGKVVPNELRKAPKAKKSAVTPKKRKK